MNRGLSGFLSVALLGSWSLSVATAQTTRHEIFLSSAHAQQAGTPELYSDQVGFRYYSAWNGFSFEPTTDGTVVFGRDRIEWGLADTLFVSPESQPARVDAAGAAHTGFKHFYDNEMRFLFRGTGLTFNYIAENRADTMHWEIVDSGQEGGFHAVASGNVDMYAANATAVGLVAAAPGTLDPNKLYMFRATALDSDGSTARRVLFADSLDVAGEVAMSRSDNLEGDLFGTWTFTNWDTPDDPISEAIEGSRASSNNPGSTIQYQFAGTSLAIVGLADTGATGVYDWSIDGGAGGSGRVDQSLDSSFSLRWPEVIVNGLAPGNHTVLITALGSPVAGALGPKPNSGFTEIDAFYFIPNPAGSGVAVNVPEPSGIALLSIVGCSCLVSRNRRSHWQTLVSWSVAACCALVLASAANAQTRHQVFKSSTAAPDMGFRYFNGASDAAMAQASDGTAVFMRDEVEWDLTQGFSHYYDNETRFLFRGTGIDLKYLKDPLGEQLNWQVIDGGYEGSYNVVASGSTNTFDAGGTSLQTLSAVAPGTLNANKLYMLRVWAKDTDLSNAKRAVFLDAVDVYGEQPFNLDDNTNTSGRWTFTNWGSPQLANSDAIGGSRAASNTANSTIQFSFNGTSVAVFGFTQSGVNGTYNWSIDNGAGGSGTIDQTMDFDFGIRFPELLVNGLTAGAHTLTITADGKTLSGRLGPLPHSGYAQIDAIAFLNAVPVAGVPGDYNQNGVVDAADYVVWRNTLGTNSALPNEVSGVTPGTVTQEDYAAWRARFGNTSGAGLGAAQVPEPAAALLGLVGLALSCTCRRERVVTQ